MSGLRAELLDPAALDGATRDAWSALEREAVEPNPFFSPEVLLPAVRHLPGGAGVRLLAVRDGARLALALPVRVGRFRRLPVPAATTWRHAYRYAGTPLARADLLAPAAGAALAGLARCAPWAVLEEAYVDGPVARALRDAARARGATWVEHDVWERPAVRRRPEATYLQETLSARSAKTLRRQRRGLARDVGPVAPRDAARGAGPAQVAEELDGFLALEAAGWKGRAGTAMADEPGAAAFLREAGAALAAAGRLELWRLDAGERAVARQVHALAGDTVFHLKTTYDEQWAKHSPGVQLELDVLDAFHQDRRLAVLDPCTDHEPGTSARLYPDRRRLGTVLVGLRPAGKAAALATPAAQRAWRAARAGLRR